MSVVFTTVLQACPLFYGLTETELSSLLGCLSAKQARYDKNAFVFHAGDPAESVGVVLSGAVHILREDYWGNRKILARIEAGGLFGEAFACAEVDRLPVAVAAAEDCAVLFINCKKLLVPCAAACGFHANTVKNLARILAEKNAALLQKLEYVTQPSTRERLLSYLSEQARITGRREFEIPFNREELADYLSVERSAMSAELSRMRRDGLVAYNKNHFELIKVK